MATRSCCSPGAPRGGPGVREVTWQPDGTAGAWAEVLDGADAVVNLAGESIAEGRWTPARKAALTESRLLSTRSLVAAIDRAKTRPPVLVSSSAVGYYGPHGDEPVTEADGPATISSGGCRLNGSAPRRRPSREARASCWCGPGWCSSAMAAH